jgi:hypothetical protein
VGRVVVDASFGELPLQPPLQGAFSPKRAWCPGCRRQCWPPAWGVVGLLSMAVGLILDSIVKGRLEARRLAYLSLG